MAAFAIMSAASSLAVFLFGFWIGRCARKLPIIDDKLPWTMHREQAPRCSSACLPPRRGAVRGEVEPPAFRFQEDDRNEPS